MVDLSNVGNGLMCAFLFLIIAMTMLFSLGMDNYSWYQPIIMQIINSISVWGFIVVMLFIGFIAGFILQEASPPL